MEANPVDYVAGVDFRITRTKKGTYNDYSTSKWSRKETGLTVPQLEAVEEHGLFDLNDWMPRRPSPEGLNAIFEMFEMTNEIRDLAFKRAPTTELRKAARASGMKSLMQDGLLKIFNAVTTADEVVRITQTEGEAVD